MVSRVRRRLLLGRKSLLFPRPRRIRKGESRRNRRKSMQTQRREKGSILIQARLGDGASERKRERLHIGTIAIGWAAGIQLTRARLSAFLSRWRRWTHNRVRRTAGAIRAARNMRVQGG